MATAKEREEFIARFVAEYAGKPAGTGPTPEVPHSMYACMEAARSLLRNARTHGNLAVEACNGPGEHITARMPYPAAGKAIEEWQAGLEKRQAAVERRIREICAEFGLPVTLGGDPRGYTVKVKFPSGAYNTWGGSEDGFGVPQ